MILEKNKTDFFNFLYSEEYQLKRGLVFSLALPLLMLPGNILKIYNEEAITAAGSEIVIFFMGFISWIGLGSITKYSHIHHKWPKISIGILTFMAISIIFYELPVIEDFSRVRFKDFPFKKSIYLILNRGFLIGFMVLSVILFFHSLERTKLAKMQVAQLVQKNQISQLNFLRQQINPHFLFNSLNVLKSGAHEEWVKDYVVKLSEVYRYLLSYNDGADLTMVSNELEFLLSYIHILKERFEDGINVSITISPEAKKRNIPVLTLQILVENAVKHNVVSILHPLHILIYDEGKYLVVVNNRQAKRNGYNRIKERSGLGLTNLKERYSLIADDTISILEEKNNFIVKIPML